MKISIAESQKQCFRKIDEFKTCSWHFIAWERRYFRSWWVSFHYWVPVWKKITYDFRNAYAPTPYDCNSVMHYPDIEVIRDGGCGSYNRLDKTTWLGNMNITDWDVYTVKKMY